MNSINHPWGISDKYRHKYGTIWSDMDFKVNKKLGALRLIFIV